MRNEAERVKRVRWVHTDQFVVAVEVEAVIPTEDPSEPCYEPETVKLLHEVEDRARAGDITWLKEHGKVYSAARCRMIAARGLTLHADHRCPPDVPLDNCRYYREQKQKLIGKL